MCFDSSMELASNSVSIMKFASSEEILTVKAIYETWHPLSASPRIYSHIPLSFSWGYEAVHTDGTPVGLMGVVYTDEAFARVKGAVDPQARGKGVGRTLLEALLSEIPSELTVVVEPTDGRTPAPSLLASQGFHCQDAGIVETFLHDINARSEEPRIPQGYELSTIITVPPEDLAAVIALEKIWCIERGQPVGPRLVSVYTGPDDGFVVLARDKERKVVGLANAELTNVEGLGLTELLVVDHSYRGRGIGRALKEIQLTSARRFGWKQMLVTVPEPDHPAARINRQLGGLGIEGLKWTRPPLT